MLPLLLKRLLVSVKCVLCRFTKENEMKDKKCPYVI